jgi:hypothetical protein
VTPPHRGFWIHLTAPQCEALMRGEVSQRLRRDFDELLNGWKQFVRPELLDGRSR